MRSPEEQEYFLEHGRFGEVAQPRARVDRLVWIGLLFLLGGAALLGWAVGFNIGRDDGGPFFLQGFIVASAIGVGLCISGFLRMRSHQPTPHPNLQALAIFVETGLVVDEAREAIALVKKRDNLHVEMGARAKVCTLQQSAAARIDDYCKDFAEWPRSWMGLPEDLVPGEKMVAYFRPFLEHLIDVGLSRKTIRKHVDNLWVLGGELIRDLHETPSLRKVPIETLVFQLIQDGGPILYHNDSEEQERSFASTCSKFRRFLQGRPSLAAAKRRWK